MPAKPKNAIEEVEETAPRLRSQLLGLYGAHIVCAELAKHGAIPIITSRNTRGVDVIGVALNGQKVVPIQVKTGRNKKRGWPVSWKDLDKTRKGPSPYFIFVSPKGKDFRDGAEFYIVPNSVVVKRGDPDRRWKDKNPGKTGVPGFELQQQDEKRFLDRWDRLGLGITGLSYAFKD